MYEKLDETKRNRKKTSESWLGCGVRVRKTPERSWLTWLLVRVWHFFLCLDWVLAIFLFLWFLVAHSRNVDMFQMQF